MSRKRSRPQVARDSGGRRSILGRLSGAEAASVLNCLLRRHPELQSEAEIAAMAVLGDVSFLAVADEVESAVLQFDYDDLNTRAGARSWGYVEPTEAAWELLEEAVEPFRDDLNRYLELGLEEQAQELCRGILLGLYRVREGHQNEILGWAEDFPGEAAGRALEVRSKAGPAEGPAGRQLPRSFVAEHIPQWAWAAKPRDEST